MVAKQGVEGIKDDFGFVDTVLMSLPTRDVGLISLSGTENCISQMSCLLWPEVSAGKRNVLSLGSSSICLLYIFDIKLHLEEDCVVFILLSCNSK